jgi:hypothetical protein
LGLDRQTVDYVSLISGNGIVGSFSQPVSDIAITGNTVVGANVTPTPEPSTLVLLAASAIGLLGYNWRRRKQKESTLSGQYEKEGPAVLSLPSRWTAARRAA